MLVYLYNRNKMGKRHSRFASLECMLTRDKEETKRTQNKSERIDLFPFVCKIYLAIHTDLYVHRTEIKVLEKKLLNSRLSSFLDAVFAYGVNIYLFF